MSRRNKSKRRPLGISPTDVIYTGTHAAGTSRIHKISFGADQFDECWCESNKDAIEKSYLKNQINWFNIFGLSDTNLIKNVGSVFGLNNFLLADLVDTKIRSKAEEIDGILSVSIKSPVWDESNFLYESELMTFVLGKDFLICFQEKEGDHFDPIRERIRLSKGTVRQREPGYLLFLLMDVVIDHYMQILDQSQDVLDRLETVIYSRPKEADYLKSQHIRSELMDMRKSILPVREAISQLKSIGKEHFSEMTMKLFVHLESNCNDCLETLEIQREMINTLTDIYFSRLNGKMNEIIKWLTIMSTIFIPLSFIVGLYGMNFKYMPELEWYYGYPSVLALMFVVVISLLFYFRKRRWI